MKSTILILIIGVIIALAGIVMLFLDLRVTIEAVLFNVVGISIMGIAIYRAHKGIGI